MRSLTGRSAARPMPSFAEFAEASWAGLYRSAYLLVGPTDAEDLVQTVLAAMYARWDSIRDPGALHGYARRSLTHAAMRRWRVRDRETPVQDLPDRPQSDLTGLGEDHLVVWQAVTALPPRMRAVVVLRFYEHFDVTETAAALGVSTGTVKSHTHQALRRLRPQLEPGAEIAPPARHAGREGEGGR